MQTDMNLMTTMGVNEPTPVAAETTNVEAETTMATETTVAEVTTTVVDSAKFGAKKVAVMAGAGAVLAGLTGFAIYKVVKKHKAKKVTEQMAEMQIQAEGEILSEMLKDQSEAAQAERGPAPAATIVPPPPSAPDPQPAKPTIITVDDEILVTRPHPEDAATWKVFDDLNAQVEGAADDAARQEVLMGAIKASCITGVFLDHPIRQFPRGITNVPFEISTQLGMAYFGAMKYWKAGGNVEILKVRCKINIVEEPDGAVRNIPLAAYLELPI